MFLLSTAIGWYFLFVLARVYCRELYLAPVFRGVLFITVLFGCMCIVPTFCIGHYIVGDMMCMVGTVSGVLFLC